MTTALLWYRRDLRITDHPALVRAAADFERVVPVFVLDDALRSGRFASAPREAFMLGCLHALAQSLRERGSGLVVREGRPERELVALAEEAGAQAVLWTSDVSPYARARDGRVTDALRAAGVQPLAQGGGYVVDVSGPRTQAGRPYSVFSPFHRHWRGIPRRPLHRAPAELAPLPGALRRGRLPAPPGGGDLPAPHCEPGEPAARAALARWLDGPIDGYAAAHDAVGEAGTSGLSPYLRWGCLSAAECEARAARRGGAGAEAWIRQLCWRDFYAHVLLAHPGNARLEHQARYRRLEWDDDAEASAEVRSGWRVRAPLAARAARRARRAPCRAVEDERRRAGGGGLRHRARLPGADRRPRRRAQAGDRALPRRGLSGRDHILRRWTSSRPTSGACATPGCRC